MLRIVRFAFCTISGTALSLSSGAIAGNETSILYPEFIPLPTLRLVHRYKYTYTTHYVFRAPASPRQHCITDALGGPSWAALMERGDDNLGVLSSSLDEQQ